MSFDGLSDEELIENTSGAVKTEKEATTSVLRHFAEIQTRMLYAKRGYSSLWKMATMYFGYSEGEAGRRISAMHLILKAPELEAEIERGILSLTVAAQVSTFCNKNNKDVREVARRVSGKSSRETERELLKIVPDAIPQEKMRAVTEDHTVATLVFDKELKEKLDNLLAIRSHAIPEQSYVALIRDLAALGEKTWNKSQRKTTSAQKPPAVPPHLQHAMTSAPESQPQSKPQSQAAIRRYIFKSANDQCTYVDPVTGRRCEARHFLEIDHILPKALGGTDDKANLRVLCRTHNQLAAVQKLGKKTMQPYLNF